LLDPLFARIISKFDMQLTAATIEVGEQGPWTR